MTDHTPDALASALPTWTVADDPYSEPTLWYGDEAVRLRCEVTETEWQVLTRVLAPDEATVERLAEALHTSHPRHPPLPPSGCAYCTKVVEAVLAALAGTSAQARHTADDATGGGA